MRSMSPSKSVPTYLNVANKVRSLSKKIESKVINCQSEARNRSRALLLTIFNVTIFDLLEDLWPNVGVALFVRS